MTVDQLYEEQIRQYSTAERFHLISRIIEDISPLAVIDYRDDWSEEDMREATAHSLRRAAESFGEE